MSKPLNPDSNVISFKVEPSLLERLRRHHERMLDEVAGLAQRHGFSASETITKSKSLRSLVLMGLDLSVVDREVLVEVTARAAANEHSLGQELGELLQFALESLEVDPQAAEQVAKQCACGVR